MSPCGNQWQYHTSTIWFNRVSFTCIQSASMFVPVVSVPVPCPRRRPASEWFISTCSYPTSVSKFLAAATTCQDWHTLMIVIMISLDNVIWHLLVAIGGIQSSVTFVCSGDGRCMHSFRNSEIKRKPIALDILPFVHRHGPLLLNKTFAIITI